ncbi:MAG: tyrosine-type recombinase/integrase [Candidatus Hodarchaeota archaeon]
MRTNNRIREEYFRELEKKCLVGLAKRSTFIQRRKAVNYFLEFLNTNHIGLKHIKSQHLHEFLQYLSLKKTYKETNFSPATLKQIYALTKTFYVRCFEKYAEFKHPDLIFTKNLLQRYKLGEKKLPKYIDQDKMRELLEKCPKEWKALLYFMYETGARISEVLGVQIQHLNVDRKLVQIFEPKTMNFRVTTLSDTTVQLLEDYILKIRSKPFDRYKKFIFISRQHRRLSVRAVQYIVKRLSSKILGKENSITPHYFRAACAVHLLESGVDIRQVQEIIGWKSLSIVQNYTRVTPQRQAQLKEQHHPSFKSQKIEQSAGKEEFDKMISQIENIRQELRESKQKHQEEIKEMKQAFQQERQERKEERQGYEQRIDKMLKTQEQLLQLLAQKST